MKTRKLVGVLAVMATLGAGSAFAQGDIAPKPNNPMVGKIASLAVCADCGTVVGIEERSALGKSSGIGAVAGGVGGAVLGKSVSDNKTGAIVGAAGGAVIGNYIERRMKKKTYFMTRVKMDDGTEREFRSDARPAWAVEQRIRTSGDTLVAMKPNDSYYRATPTVLAKGTAATSAGTPAPSTGNKSSTTTTNVAPQSAPTAPATSSGPKLKEN